MVTMSDISNGCCNPTPCLPRYKTACEARVGGRGVAPAAPPAAPSGQVGHTGNQFPDMLGVAGMSLLLLCLCLAPLAPSLQARPAWLDYLPWM